MRFATVYIYFCGLGFFALGIISGFYPETLTDLYGVRFSSFAGKAGIASLIGGLEIAIGFICIFHKVCGFSRQNILWLLSLIFVSLIAIRGFYLIQLELVASVQMWEFLFELSLALIGIFLLRRRVP